MPCPYAFMTTKILLTMPQPGETITEGNVVRWIAKPGASIKEGEPIVELETEKAVFEYESPYEGQLVEILAEDGSTVPVGNPIAVFEVEDEKAATYFMLGIGQKMDAALKKDVTPSKKAKGGGKGKEKKLSPLVRKLIQEYGIELEDLDLIQGTGPGGRITKENIVQYIESKKGKAVSTGKDVEVTPLSPIRVRIAENMSRSKATIPHAHASLSVDMTPLVEYRNQNKDKFEKKHGVPLGIFSLIFPALKKAITENTIVNSSFREQGGKKMVATYQKINLAVAVDTDQGLFLPVIHEAQQLDYIQLSKGLMEMIDKARENKLSPSELTGRTFTFNNYGYYGTTFGVQIILPPQSTTLGMGLIEKRPWVVGDAIQIRQITDFTLAFDHRIIDGKHAGLFLSSLKKYLEGFSEKDLSV